METREAERELDVGSLAMERPRRPRKGVRALKCAVEMPRVPSGLGEEEICNKKGADVENAAQGMEVLKGKTPATQVAKGCRSLEVALGRGLARSPRGRQGICYLARKAGFHTRAWEMLSQAAEDTGKSVQDSMEVSRGLEERSER